MIHNFELNDYSDKICLSEITEYDVFQDLEVINSRSLYAVDFREDRTNLI